MTTPQQWLDKEYPNKNKKTTKKIDLTGLKSVTEVGGLTISDYPELTDIKQEKRTEKYKINKLTINKCPKLKNIDCSHNQLTGLVVDKPEQLNLLNISYNEFNSDLKILEPFVNLTTLGLSNNKFTGSLASLQNLKKITWLDVGNNKNLNAKVEHLPVGLAANSHAKLFCIGVGGTLTEELKGYGTDGNYDLERKMKDIFKSYQEKTETAPLTIKSIRKLRDDEFHDESLKNLGKNSPYEVEVEDAQRILSFLWFYAYADQDNDKLNINDNAPILYYFLRNLDKRVKVGNSAKQVKIPLRNKHQVKDEKVFVVYSVRGTEDVLRTINQEKINPIYHGIDIVEMYNDICEVVNHFMKDPQKMAGKPVCSYPGRVGVGEFTGFYSGSFGIGGRKNGENRVYGFDVRLDRESRINIWETMAHELTHVLLAKKQDDNPNSVKPYQCHSKVFWDSYLEGENSVAAFVGKYLKTEESKSFIQLYKVESKIDNSDIRWVYSPDAIQGKGLANKVRRKRNLSENENLDDVWKEVRTKILEFSDKSMNSGSKSEVEGRWKKLQYIENWDKEERWVQVYILNKREIMGKESKIRGVWGGKYKIYIFNYPHPSIPNDLSQNIENYAKKEKGWEIEDIDHKKALKLSNRILKNTCGLHAQVEVPPKGAN